jgi:hypothetical protein
MGIARTRESGTDARRRKILVSLLVTSRPDQLHPVKDDWPEDVPVTEAEIEVFEAWFGDLFDELFSTRH